MSPESPVEIQLVVSAQSLATFLVSWPLTSGWADSALTVSRTLWLSGCAWLAVKKGRLDSRV